MKPLAQLIADCRAVAGLGEDFALFYTQGEWLAGIVNQSSYLWLGEVEAKHESSWHETAENAVAELLKIVTEAKEAESP